MKLTFYNIYHTLLRVTLSAMIITAAILAISCSDDYNPPSEPIFSDVELIEIEYPRNEYDYTDANKFQYNIPDSVSYLVLAIFVLDFASSVPHTGNEITLDMNGGSSSIIHGISMSTATKNDLYEFNGDFTDTPYSGPANDTECHLVIIGLDDNYNIVAASPDWRFTW